MRAKQVYEFKQGQNPYKTMELGSNRPYAVGDEFQCIQEIFYDGEWQPEWFTHAREYFRTGSNHKIIFIDSTIQHDVVYQMDNPMKSWLELKDLKMYFRRI
jgi:hypothetical protein